MRQQRYFCAFYSLGLILSDSSLAVLIFLMVISSITENSQSFHLKCLQIYTLNGRIFICSISGGLDILVSSNSRTAHIKLKCSTCILHNGCFLFLDKNGFSLCELPFERSLIILHALSCTVKADVNLFSGLNYGEMRTAFRWIEPEKFSLLHEDFSCLAVISNLLHQPEGLSSTPSCSSTLRVTPAQG